MKLFGEQTLKFNHAAASYLQLPIFVCTQKSKSLEYYWDCFFPLITKVPTNGDHFTNMSDLSPIILRFATAIGRCHYDVITKIDGNVATSAPTIDVTVDYLNLTIEESRYIYSYQTLV